MRFHYKSLFAAFAVFAALNIAAAQDKITGSVDIYKDFKANLMESNKVNVTPTLPAIDTSKKKQDYIVPLRPLSVDYPAPKLRPIAIKSAKKSETYNGFAKLGAGMPKQFWGEAGYYFASGDKFDGKAWFRHHSLNNSENVENQRFFNNDFLLDGNVYVNENLAVGGNIGYSYDRVHFYGYNYDTLSFSEERTRQDVKILDMGARVFNSHRTESDVNFSVAPKFYLLNDYYSNKENAFNLDMAVTKWFAEKHPLRLGVRVDQTTFEDTVEQKLNNLYLQPSFTFHSDIVRLRVGGNFVNNRDEFTSFPDIELTLKAIGNYVQVFGGLGGDLRKNTFRSMIEYNPFNQVRGIELLNTEYRNYYGGAKGDLGFIDYFGQFTYSESKNLALFQTKFTDEGLTRFATVYDDATITNVQAALRIKPMEALSLVATASQNITFELLEEEHSWGVPKTEVNVNAIYALSGGKGEIRGGFYFAEGIWFKDLEGVSRQGEALYDLNFGASIFFSKNIGGFLDINNVLNNKRERWYNYPMVGANFIIGLTARF